MNADFRNQSRAAARPRRATSPTAPSGPAMRSTRMLSCGACAPSPTAPRPSSVGTPSAAVKLPSEPPPVSDSSSSTPSSARQLLRRRGTACTIPAVRSMGGRFSPPETSIEQRLSKGRRLRNLRSSAAASFSRTTRISTSARASAATTLVRVPPANHARIHRDAALQIRETRRCASICRASSSIGARAGCEVHARVRRLAPHHHGVIAHALARRLELAFQPRARLQHQHRLAARRRFSVSGAGTRCPLLRPS